MTGLPMAHYLEFEEILPVRPYEGFAEDVRRRWHGSHLDSLSSSTGSDGLSL
jgi:hypothetical protein